MANLREMDASIARDLTQSAIREDHSSMAWFLIGMLALALFSTACSSKKRIRPEEVPTAFVNPNSKAKDRIKLNDSLIKGSFHTYTQAELKKLKLKSEDFEFDSLEHKNKIIDPRLEEGQSVRLDRLYLTETGDFVEWRTDVFVQQVKSTEVQVVYNGEISNSQGQSVPYSQSVNCKAQLTELSSGVRIPELTCDPLDLRTQFQSLGQQLVSCAIKPVGTNAITRDTKLGAFKIQGSNAVYAKSKKETITTRGDVYCGRDNLGLGEEVRTVISSAETPNILYPALGTPRRLFESRKIQLKDGSIASMTTDEVMGSDGSPVGSTKLAKSTARR